MVYLVGELSSADSTVVAVSALRSGGAVYYYYSVNLVSDSGR